MVRNRVGEKGAPMSVEKASRERGAGNGSELGESLSLSESEPK